MRMNLRKRAEAVTRDALWLLTSALLVGAPIFAMAGDGFNLTQGGIVVSTDRGGEGDAGYALSGGTISAGVEQSISPTARLVACMSWGESTLPDFCGAADLDDNSRVNLRDFADLQNGFDNP